jgi:predicted protein tyrosine phosphatase
MSVPRLLICPLGELNRVSAGLGSFDLLSLLSPGHVGDAHRELPCRKHLELSFHDITEPRTGLVVPDQSTIGSIIEFGRQREYSILIHCWAGISRSSAAAYILASESNPGYEHDIGRELRLRAPFATPNRLMIEIADNLLNRGGRMIAAIESIGRGAEAFEGKPYEMPLVWPIE